MINNVSIYSNYIISMTDDISLETMIQATYDSRKLAAPPRRWPDMDLSGKTQGRHQGRVWRLWKEPLKDPKFENPGLDEFNSFCFTRFDPESSNLVIMVIRWIRCETPRSM